MIKKIIFLLIIIAVVYGVISLWGTYREYRIREAARVERIQQQAEDVKITTIEGWTIADITDYLDKQGLVKTGDFEKTLTTFDLTSYPLIAESKPAKADLEGYLFPDTYRFTKDTTPEAVLQKMLDNFIQRMATIGVKAGQGLYEVPGYESLELSTNDQKGLSFYQLLVLASIVEKETGGAGDGASITAEQERKLIAGVFYNRVMRGQALQSDATVNYVTGKNTPSISGQDLELNSPYNTYKYPGLPPGPIANPSLASMKAVLNPTVTDYNYFFHRQPSGIVVFSKTFDEHKKRQLE